jgi:S-adenosyl-L-methionine hydrolase (adenosine-forming)
VRRILLGLVVAAMACAPEDAPRDPGTLLFLTDFGTQDGAVAVCKGVMLGVAPRLRVVDISHEIPPYDIATAGEVVEQALPWYPAGTVVVAVVDPGVGSTRKAIAILTKKGHLLVGPDNGLFTLVLEGEGLERAVEISNKRFVREGDASYTFHGRDIFSPAGAHLAAGVPIDSLGPPVTPVRLDVRPARLRDGAVVGEVRYIEDPYGNVVSNIPAALLDSAGLHVGDSVDVRVGARQLRLPWRRTFSDVAVGAPLAVMHERGLLSFSLNQADFARRYAVKRKDSLAIRRLRAR